MLFFDFVVFCTRLLDTSPLPSSGLLSFVMDVFMFELSTRVTGAAHAYREKGRVRQHGSSSFMRASRASMTMAVFENFRPFTAWVDNGGPYWYAIPRARGHRYAFP